MPLVLLVVTVLIVTLIVVGPALDRLIDRTWPPIEDTPPAPADTRPEADDPARGG